MLWLGKLNLFLSFRSVIRQEGQRAGIISAGRCILSIVSVILILTITASLELEWWKKSVCYSSHSPWSCCFQTKCSVLIGHLLYQKAATVALREQSGNSTTLKSPMNTGKKPDYR